MRPETKGRLHPLTQIIYRSTKILERLGFSIAGGPEIEDEWHNFDALNMPADHPAREMQDTFWIKPEGKSQKARLLLRTHTSPVQIRYLETHAPPLAVIAPGRVFRHETTDATHEAQFHQLEGLWVAERVSLADLKGVVEKFFSDLLGPSSRIRLRPSYFPFVEPGVEVDVWFGEKWLEIMGAGLVHPGVFESVKLDPARWSGFAFGVGLDRLAMLEWGIDDMRRLYRGTL